MEEYFLTGIPNIYIHKSKHTQSGSRQVKYRWYNQDKIHPHRQMLGISVVLISRKTDFEHLHNKMHD